MNQGIDLKSIIESKYPRFFRTGKFFKERILLKGLNWILCISEINDLLVRHSNENARRFLENVFEEIDISYSISRRDRDRIPSEGRLLIAANHPLGGIDGLLLIKLLLEIRKDVKVIVNDLLMSIFIL
jgi:putative hemolysin